MALEKQQLLFTLLPDFIKVNEYVNADSIAAAVAIEAGRLMLNRINTLVTENKNFAFETTLASKTFSKLIKECKVKGYKTNLMFLWLDNPIFGIFVKILTHETTL